mmetsp:Transcript_8852/g.12119  ORF Transcript_8852/g.12119 Transcript_8852/m.12119 type:complete len:160 (-) Transcript_8852:121-600(-)
MKFAIAVLLATSAAAWRDNYRYGDKRPDYGYGRKEAKSVSYDRRGRGGKTYATNSYSDKSYGAGYDRGYDLGYDRKGYGSKGYGERGYGAKGYGERSYDERSYGERGYGSRDYGSKSALGYGKQQRAYGKRDSEGYNRGYSQSSYKQEGLRPYAGRRDW